MRGMGLASRTPAGSGPSGHERRKFAVRTQVRLMAPGSSGLGQLRSVAVFTLRWKVHRWYNYSLAQAEEAKWQT